MTPSSIAKGASLVATWLLLGPGIAGAATPQGTAFTYQGQLKSSGAPVDASCKFIFALWDASSGGSQVGSTLTYDGAGANPAPLAVTGGVFTTTPPLDFGNQFHGDERWLDVQVKCGSDPGYTDLGRQKLAGSPYALSALTLQGYPVSQTAPTSNQVLQWNGSDWAPATVTSLPPSGSAGGDLSGSFPNPVIAANAVTSAKILDGTITNNDVSPVAAVSYSKLNLSGSIQGSDVASGTFWTTNSRHALGNNDNTARELRLLEPSGSGVNFTSFKAQVQAADLTYTLPSAAPTAASQVLQVQAVAGNAATLAWGAVGGGSILFHRTGVVANAGNPSYNVVSADDIVGVDMSAGTNFTVNLQAATTAGEILIVKVEKYNNALLPVLTIQPNGTDKIDGNNNLAFGNAGGNRRLYSDGAGNWYTW